MGDIIDLVLLNEIRTDDPGRLLSNLINPTTVSHSLASTEVVKKAKSREDERRTVQRDS